MTPVVQENQMKASAPRVLVVDDEPTLLELIGDVVAPRVNCRIIAAHDLREARKILATQKIELLVTDINLPDGNGMSLLPTLQEHQPTASAIVITGDPSVDSAVNALRQGAADFVPKPFTADMLTERFRKALARQAILRKQDRRLERLRDAVKRLNEARRIVTRKVDLLCNDLITAYGELAKQLDTVRTQESFRKYLETAKDLEQLLCHTMDWLLRQLGYANVAIWLASATDEFQLGAYMKYTIPGDAPLSEAMRKNLVPLTVRHGILRIDPEHLSEMLSPAEAELMKGQAIMAINCTYLAEPLAAMILFRDADKPFTDEDEAMLKMISPVFATALASAVKGLDDEEGDVDGDTSVEDEDKKRRDPKNDADWWKRGEDPPF